MISQFPTIPCKFKRLRLGLEAGAGPGLAKGKCFKTSSFPKTKKTTQTTEHNLTLSLSPEMDVLFCGKFQTIQWMIPGGTPMTEETSIYNLQAGAPKHYVSWFKNPMN